MNANPSDPLEQALARLRRMPVSASPGTAALILGAFRAHHERRRRRRVAILASLAAVLLFVFVAAKLLHPRPPVPSAREARFIALPYSQSGVPLEQGIVIRVDLPSADLVQFGVPPSLRPKSERVRAEFLIGQDGMARAVRFLPAQTNSF